MNVEIVGRHMDLPPSLEEYARRKAEKVAKFLKEDVRVEVVIEKVHDDHQIEMIVSGHRGPVIVSNVHHGDARAAIDLSIDKVEHQLRKYKDRHKHHQGESMAGEATSAPERDEPEPSFDDVIDEELNK